MDPVTLLPAGKALCGGSPAWSHNSRNSVSNRFHLHDIFLPVTLLLLLLLQVSRTIYIYFLNHIQLQKEAEDRPRKKKKMTTYVCIYRTNSFSIHACTVVELLIHEDKLFLFLWSLSQTIHNFMKCDSISHYIVGSVWVFLCAEYYFRTTYICTTSIHPAV